MYRYMYFDMENYVIYIFYEKMDFLWKGIKRHYFRKQKKIMKILSIEEYKVEKKSVKAI